MKPLTKLQKSIIDLIVRESGMTIEQFEAHDRHREFNKWRHLLGYALAEYGNMSLKSVGWVIGARDHSTICHSKIFVNNVLSINSDIYYQDYMRVLATIEIITHKGEKQMFKTMYANGSSLAAVIGLMTQID